jgi:hypothetical protein
LFDILHAATVQQRLAGLFHASVKISRRRGVTRA